MVSHNPSTITSYEVPALPSMQQGLCQLKQRELFPLISLFTTDVWAQFPPPTRDKVRGDVYQSPGAALPSHSVPGRHGCCYRPSLCVCSGSRGSLFVASNGTTLFVISFVYKREFCVLLPSRKIPFLVGCLAGPVYIHPGIQGGPGQIGVLNSDWSRIWDAVDAVGSIRSEDAPLGYSSLTRCFQAGFQ